MIFIERDTALSKEEIENRLALLQEAFDSGDDDLAREALRKTVPTFRTPEEVNKLCWMDKNENFFDIEKFAGEGNIGHMLKQAEIYKDKLF